MRRETGLIPPAPPAELQALFSACQLPFVWSALSGLPLVGGLPKEHCPYFGYWNYLDRPGGWEGPGPTLTGCQRGARLGFANVVRVTEDPRGPGLTVEKCDRR